MTMYESWFNMKHTPFTRNIPPEKLYESPAIGAAFDRLCYVADRQQFAVVTADSGCGKSTLIRRFAASLPSDKYILLYLSDSKLTPKWLYKGILDQLGMESKFYRGDSKRQLQESVAYIHGVEQKKLVCVLDEAHLLEKETLEEFRFLLNCSFDSESPMALVLVGQTELWDRKLRYKRYDAIRQRIDLYCVLPHLDRAETEQYIRTHISYSECAQELFTDKAVDEVHKYSTGIPRVINRLCDKSLMYAFQQQKRLVDDHMVQYMAENEMLTLAREE
jgi:type II secretory pathway predicted ATPase ExeA